MQQRELLYESKVKKVYLTDDPDLCIVSYKDDATAFSGLKKGSITGKGVVDNKVSNFLMQKLEESGIPTYLVKEISERDALVKNVQLIPLEIVVRNVVAGSLSKRLGIPEGTKLIKTVLEFCYKKDELGDPMVNFSHILAMGFATQEELELISEYALKVNEILSKVLLGVNIELVDFKIEFGKTSDGKIVLADEISPDTCRFWDTVTHEKLDKDRFRRDLGDVEGAYNEVLKRLLGE